MVLKPHLARCGGVPGPTLELTTNNAPKLWKHYGMQDATEASMAGGSMCRPNQKEEPGLISKLTGAELWPGVSCEDLREPYTFQPEKTNPCGTMGRHKV